MHLKNPTILPNKFLGAPHFSSSSASRCTDAFVSLEISPLLALAEKKFWVEKGASPRYVEEVIQKNPKAVWITAKNWPEKLREDSEEDGPAIAGWMLLRNLTICQKIRETHIPPYLHLVSESEPSTLLSLNHHLFYNSSGNTKQKSTAVRDLLAILLIKHSQPAYLKEEVTRNFGGDAFYSASPNWLKLSHGIDSKYNGWKTTTQAYVASLVKTLLRKEPTSTIFWVKSLQLEI